MPQIPKVPQIPNFDLDSIYDSTEPEPTKEKSWWETITSAPEIIAKPAHELGKSVSKWIDPEQGSSGLRSGLSAYAEAVADTAAGMTSPLNLTANALTLGGYGAAAAGAPTAAKALGWTGAALNLPDMYQGTKQVFQGEHLDEQLAGLASVVFGGMGVKEGADVAHYAGYGPKPAPKPDPKLPISDVVIPDNLMGTNTYAGPERRDTGTRPKADAANVAFKEYRERLARGEDVRSPQSMELFNKKQNLDNSREAAAETYVQEKPEIGDIIVDKLGNDHEFMGYDARGKETWKLTGKKTDPDVDLDAQYDNAVAEMPTNVPRDPFNAEYLASIEPQKMKIDPNSFELVNPDEGFGNNASGDSGASMEANSRLRGMSARGEKFVVYDRAGRRREMIGPEAVDYNAANGETFGIEYNDGRFSPLVHRGGKVPAQDFRTQLKDTKASIKKAGQDIPGWEPQKMRVPGTAKKGGLDNVAMGGADPRVLDIIGNNLYSKDTQVIAAKELLQNAFDEQRIAGVSDNVRVGVDYNVKNPVSGKDSHALTVRDSGRGMTPEQIYTVFSDIGKTGKGTEESASGGFGIAKASPMLGGNLVDIETITMENGKPVKYTFQGTPDQLKNQKVGVPLKKVHVDPGTKTGTRVTVHYDNKPSFYQVSDYVQKMTERSTGLPSGLDYWENYYHPDPQYMHPGTVDQFNEFIGGRSYEDKSAAVDRYSMKPLPDVQGSLDLPNARVDIRYDPKELGESQGYNLHTQNKGLYQASSNEAYGMSALPGVPSDIIADIIAKVEEGSSDPAYPFSANREQLHATVQREINKWIKENIAEGATKNRVDTLQKMYDDITPLTGNTTFLDTGNQFTPDEIEYIRQSPAMEQANRVLERVNNEILGIADTLNWMPGSKPSQKLQKFGLLFEAPDAEGNVTLGIHIPNPGQRDQSAILINLFEHLNQVVNVKDNPADWLATGLYTTITHEQAHIPGGGHDTGFAYRHAKLLASAAQSKTVDILGELYASFHDPATGGINPELHDVLRVYNQSRKRKSSGKNDLTATGISSKGQANSPGGKGSNGQGASNSAGPTGVINSTGGRTTPPISAPQVQAAMKNLYQLQAMHKMAPTKAVKESLYAKIRDFNKTILTSLDVSGAGRQGLPLIAEKEYWTSLDDMFKSLGSKAYYESLHDAVATSPFAQKRYAYVKDKLGNNIKSRQTGQYKVKELESFYDTWGLDLAHREETMGSKYAEMIPGVAASNRAYSGFLTKLRFDTFNRMAQDMMNTGIDIRQDIVAGKKLAEFINNSTGRGSLGRAEKISGILSNVFFAPRLMAAKVNRFVEGGKLLNPRIYKNTPPAVRQAMIKSLVSTAGIGLAAGQLVQQFGYGTVNPDPTSSDFGKIKIGKTRIDPFGGDQQYVVAAARMLSGRNTSPNANRMDKAPKDYQEFFKNAGTTGFRFGRNKLAPIPGFVTSLFMGENALGQPFEMQRELMDSTIPLVLQDMQELYKTDPGLWPLALLPVLGISTQSFTPRTNRHR